MDHICLVKHFYVCVTNTVLFSCCLKTTKGDCFIFFVHLRKINRDVYNTDYLKTVNGFYLNNLFFLSTWQDVYLENNIGGFVTEDSLNISPCY